MRLCPIKYGVKVVAPVRDVVSNLNFDGSYFDDAGNTWNNYGTSGAIVTSTAQSKFGGSSLYSNGANNHQTYIKSDSGILTTTSFGLRSFTLRMWILVDAGYVQSFPNSPTVVKGGK